MSTLATNAITDASGGNTATINGYTPTMSNMAGRNRIINGDMRIDQRNAGASSTNIAFTVDRWNFQGTVGSKLTWGQNYGSVTPPAGFSKYLGFSTTTAYAVTSGDYFFINQVVEGYNIADLDWGTANAKPATLSFYVRSSITGTHGGSLICGSSSYPFAYTISSANTWTQITISVPANTSYSPTSTTNGAGATVVFGLGIGSTYSGTAGAWSGSTLFSATGATSVVGTSGATFYITGVQLEEGSVATPFEHRQYGQELALCQRYYERFGNGLVGGTRNDSTYNGDAACRFLVPKRAVPTISYLGGTMSGITPGVLTFNVTALRAATPSINGTGVQLGFNVNMGGSYPFIIPNNTSVDGLEASAEL